MNKDSESPAFVVAVAFAIIAVVGGVFKNYGITPEILMERIQTIFRGILLLILGIIALGVAGFILFKFYCYIKEKYQKAKSWFLSVDERFSKSLEDLDYLKGCSRGQDRDISILERDYQSLKNDIKKLKDFTGLTEQEKFEAAKKECKKEAS